MNPLAPTHRGGRALSRSGLLLEQALALYQQGHLLPAAELASRGLRESPKNVGLWNLAATLAMRRGDSKEAARCWRWAVTLDPRSAALQCNLGFLSVETGQLQAAALHFGRALELDPSNAPACFGLGVVLERGGSPAEAEEHYRRALSLDPAHAGANAQLGSLLAAAGHNAEAEPLLRHALAATPERIDLGLALATALRRMNQVHEAEAVLRSALTRAPGHRGALRKLAGVLMRLNRQEEADRCFVEADASEDTIALVNRGLLCRIRRQPAEAEALFRRALARQPNLLGGRIALGELLDEQGLFDEADDCFRLAQHEHPDSALPHAAQGGALARRGDIQAAEPCFRAAAAGVKDGAIGRMALAGFLLQEGRYEEGFRAYDVRLSPEHPDRVLPPPAIDCPAWNGEPLTGRSILIWPEQGHGDLIQCVRYAAELRALGAARVDVVAHDPLVPLLRGQAHLDRVYGFAEFDAAKPRYDCWSYAMGLPLRCGTTFDTIPAKLPYLAAPADRIAKWRDRLPADGLRVGLAWKGSAGHRNDAARSLPSLEVLAPLWSVPGVRFVSLQKGRAEDEAIAPPPGQPLLHLGGDIRDFADSAAIVQQLDLVISVDTALVHLAGALGKPCWVLLATNVDWRWQRSSNSSRWYPGALRLFRQGRAGDWSAPVEEMAGALKGH